MKLNATIILLLLYSTSFTYGQKIVRSSINSFGSVVQSEGVKLSQTAGQSSNHSVLHSNIENIQLRQGFQQVNNNILPVKSKGLQFTVYPNPNNGEFSIAFNERTTGEVKYRLIDNQGRIYKDNKFISNGVNYFNFNLPSGSYILQLINPEGRSGIAKIIILP
ncbi:MAG TPA: T9SS type A sorting domain-containing protein [Brumimicrobium sp.]|nr:T9SS type A sorting domain-containing protein [Brumimicrobium sp.]